MLVATIEVATKIEATSCLSMNTRTWPTPEVLWHGAWHISDKLESTTCGCWHQLSASSPWPASSVTAGWQWLTTLRRSVVGVLSFPTDSNNAAVTVTRFHKEIGPDVYLPDSSRRESRTTATLSVWHHLVHEDALGNTIPPASPVLRCLLYLVPSDLYLLGILVDDSLPVLTWASRPSPETIGLPVMSLSCDPVTFHAWKMSEPLQSSASNNVFQLGECSCLSDFLICHFVLPGNAQDTSLPCMASPTSPTAVNTECGSKAEHANTSSLKTSHRFWGNCTVAARSMPCPIQDAARPGTAVSTGWMAPGASCKSPTTVISHIHMCRRAVGWQVVCCYRQSAWLNTLPTWLVTFGG